MAAGTANENGNEGAGTTASASSSIRRKRVKKKNTSPTGNDEPAPTLSFYAAAAAALALGAQLYLEKHGTVGSAHDIIGAAGGGLGGGVAPARGTAGSTSSASSNATAMGFDSRTRSKSPLVPTVFAPSGTPPKDGLEITDELHEDLMHSAKIALLLHAEQSGHATCDVDYIYAHILLSHYLRHFEAKGRSGNTTKKGKGKRKATASRDDGERGFSKLPSLHPDLAQLVAKLVVLARQMGLDHEGDSISNDVFTEFDRETRRRLWWEIVVLDW